MKITQWLGFNENSSQYLLRKGELRALVNLQPRRDGMLISRQGILKLYGKYDDEGIYGLYRRDTLVNDATDFLCFQKLRIDRELTAAQIAANEFPEKDVWVVRRIQGFQERVINQQEISPSGLTNITNFCVAEDRHGRLFIFYGHGARPVMYRPGSIANVAVSMGVDAPASAPQVDPSGTGYFLESVDVLSGGGSYWGPPTITVDGGDPSRPAKVKAIVQAGNLVGVDVIDGGAGYKSFPKVVVGSDKIGSGFRAIGNLETDPGVQGFLGTVPGTVSGTAPTESETYGSANTLTGNKIMYLASAVSASTRTVAVQSSSATTAMTVESIAGINVGDVATVYSGTVPTAFASGAVIRVLDINESTKVLTLSKQWTPAVGVSYFVQFRSSTDIGYADAQWDATTKRFRASVPLRTTRGVGRGAEATLTFSPAAYSYGLGTFSRNGYTTPTSTVEPVKYAYLKAGWQTYLYGEYWAGSQANVKNSSENKTYAGLQASGKTLAFGYTGTVSTQGSGKAINRRADVYWPDYSSLSVWTCTGNLITGISQWKRQDVPVYYDAANGGRPYILVTLTPTLKARLSSATGKMSYATVNKQNSTAPNFRYPVVRVNLSFCPDSWVTTSTDNGSYNLPFSVKESQSNRLAWWHTSGVTPRPIVDFYSASSNPDSQTVQVVDPGAGWERGTTFAIRFYQANPYSQTQDYNTAVRESKIKGSHAAFSNASRFATFVFEASEPDDLTPAGPPNTLAGNQYIDVPGTGYRTGDTASVTLLKRSISSAESTASLKFDGVMTAGGQSTEFTYTSNVQNAGAVLTNLDSTGLQVNVGDVITCADSGVLQPFSQVLSRTATSITLDKMRDVAIDPSATVGGFVSSSEGSSGTTYGINFGTATLSSFIAVGRKLYDTTSAQVCTITAINTYTVGNDLYTAAQVSGSVTAGTRTFLPVLSLTANAGTVSGQTLTWTAAEIASGTGEQRVTSIRIISGGRNYNTPPTIITKGGGNGYGLAVTPTVSDGKVTSVEIVDPGRAYTAQPELYTDSTAATAVPVMRPAMRGKYRCAYRYADRSETQVATCTLNSLRGESPTTVVLSSTVGVEPGVILESPRLPPNTRVLSRNQGQVELNQPASGVGPLGRVVVENGGSGYALDEAVTCTVTGASNAVLSVRLAANDYGSYSVKEVVVTSAGTGMLGVGKIAVQFSPPAAGGSTASGYAAIDRFDTSASYDRSVIVRDMTKPIAYSDFSPIFDVDAGPNDERDHCSELKWTLSGANPPARADMVELWRTSADQSLVFYRLEAYGVPSDSGVEIVGTDTMTDEELFDSDRPNYAAMPVVLPNGNVNAYRFGVPRSDMSVCVAFQDRLWYAVTTSGEARNTLFYSEFDEFESCPDVNDLPIQNNQRATDSITALVPFGSLLLAMQHMHTYGVTYNTDPSIDSSIQMLSHRGCLHQRCWDIHENTLYAVDENGIYSLSRSGEILPISDPIRDYFTSELIDFSKRESFFLTICPRTHILRFFFCMAAQSEDTPTHALCYDIPRKAWWTERYPNSFCSAVTGRPGITRINSSIYGAVDGNLYEFSDDKDHANQTLTHCVVTSVGSGYNESPEITCPSSKGVQLKGVVSEGRLVDILVLSGGWDCKWGVQLLAENGSPLAGHDGKNIKGVEYAPINLDIAAPSGAGAQAAAVAHFSVTTRLARDVTVSEGESFVRIASFVTNPILTNPIPLLTTEDGDLLDANGGDIDGVPLQTEPPPVEIGMEAIGDYLPLNCFVSKIIGQDIYLEHPDGTAVSMLGGDVRTGQSTGGTRTIVYFRKPFYTHIPFRLATGALQLANEDNVAKGGDSLIDRSITLVYAPTPSDKEVEIIEYFNDSSTPRPNIMRRSRGGPQGFTHRQDSASTVLNTSRNASNLGIATGVAKAKFASRVYTDMVGEDQHVQVELLGRPLSANGGEDRVPHKFVMHSLAINGVIENGE
jgi:hypothetical protein